MALCDYFQQNGQTWLDNQQEYAKLDKASRGSENYLRKRLDELLEIQGTLVEMVNEKEKERALLKGEVDEIQVKNSFQNSLNPVSFLIKVRCLISINQRSINSLFSLNKCYLVQAKVLELRRKANNEELSKLETSENDRWIKIIIIQ